MIAIFFAADTKRIWDRCPCMPLGRYLDPPVNCLPSLAKMYVPFF